MRLLLICNDYYHPGQIAIDGFAPLDKYGFQFDIITDTGDFAVDVLNNYPAAILCKCDNKNHEDRTSWKTGIVQQAFISYVENGGGLLVVHSGTTAGEHTEALDRLIGCRFASHPEQCPVTVQAVKPHPVTEGVEMFRETDEHYRIEILSSDIDILFASYSHEQGEKEKYLQDPYHNTTAWISAAGYVRTQGKGRVCVLTPGHNLAVWQNRNFQQMLVNAMKWCSREI